MDVQNVVAQLRQEVARIEQAIAALVGLGSRPVRRGRPSKASYGKPASPDEPGHEEEIISDDEGTLGTEKEGGIARCCVKYGETFGCMFGCIVACRVAQFSPNSTTYREAKSLSPHNRDVGLHIFKTGDWRLAVSMVRSTRTRFRQVFARVYGN